MTTIAENLAQIKSTIPDHCTLVAVSKTKPTSAILQAYQADQLDFGENKVQELAQKAEELPKDIRWHMIGHLQRNKVKYIAPFVHLIHGVDSIRLLKEVEKQAQKVNRVIDCLLQVHIADEETKFGFGTDEVMELLQSDELQSLHHVRIVGLMGMATNTTDQSKVAAEFRKLKSLFERLKTVKNHLLQINVLSMGMSGDYTLAISEGSTMVRIGSAIFGSRH